MWGTGLLVGATCITRGCGEMRLLRNRFLIPDSDGQHLQVYHAMPGTDTAEKLARLTRP